MKSSEANYSISIVIPAFNEDANITPTVEEAIVSLRETPWISARFILVNDGSTDRTLQEMNNLSRRFSDITVLSHPINKGLGAAIYSGMMAATTDWISWLPADGQIPPENLPRLMHAISDEMVAILLRPENQRSLGRRLLTTGFNLVVKAAVSNRYSRYSGIFVVPRSRITSLKLVANTAVQNLVVVEHCIQQGTLVKAVEGTLRPRASGISKVANTKTTIQTLLETITVKRKIRSSQKQC
jgi:glycosyltransferase involved in cell wall biosynthesis